MHIGFIIKNVLDYMYKRKINFILTIIISVVTMYLLAMVLTLAGESYYYIYAVKNTIKNTQYLNINIFMDPSNMDYCANVEAFDKEMKKDFGNQYGKFMFVTTNLQNQVTEFSESSDVLYIDSTLADVCKETIDFENAVKNTQRIKACVGSSLSEKYPVGTILKNINTGSELEIVGTLKNEQTWIPSLLFHTKDAVVSLDKYIVAEMDDSFFNTSLDFYANAFNSFYIKCESEQECADAKNKVKEIAGQNKILYYANTVDELISQEKDENKALFQSVGNLTIFVVLIAILAFVSANLSDIYSRHNEFGIMYINGVSSLDIYFMIWIENLIKFVSTFGISIYMYKKGLDEVEAYVLVKMIIPLLIISILLFSVILSYILLLTVKRRNVLSLLGGVKL